MIDIAYKELMEQVQRGAFLTVEHAGELNTMTIGWFEFGIFWSREVMTVGVRPTRFTHHIIEGAGCYSVTIPKPGTFADELALCGSQSGRDIDKFKECSLPLAHHGKDNIPYIPVEGEHLFGRTIFKTVIQPEELADKLESYYPEKDYHTVYTAEITDWVTV